MVIVKKSSSIGFSMILERVKMLIVSKNIKTFFIINKSFISYRFKNTCLVEIDKNKFD